MELEFEHMSDESSTTENHEKRRRSREIAEARYGFRWNLGVYIAVNAVLWLLRLVIGPRFSGGFPWPIFVTAFWGIGVGANYVHAYHQPDQSWIDRKTDRILGSGERHDEN